MVKKRYEELKKSTLQAKARKRGLKAEGTKKQLIARLRAANKSSKK